MICNPRFLLIILNDPTYIQHVESHQVRFSYLQPCSLFFVVYYMTKRFLFPSKNLSFHFTTSFSPSFQANPTPTLSFSSHTNLDYLSVPNLINFYPSVGFRLDSVHLGSITWVLLIHFLSTYASPGRCFSMVLSPDSVCLVTSGHHQSIGPQSLP